MTSSESSAEYYGKDLEAMDSASNYYSWILDEFGKRLGATVLEVGAGSGNFSVRLLQCGPQLLCCLEPSGNGFAALQQRFSGHPAVETHQGTLARHAGGWSERFDSIVYVNVLEHIENDADELRLALECLKPGGYLLIFVPALQWLYGSADLSVGHFRRYGRRTLEALFRDRGASIEVCRYWDILGILPWWFTFVLLRRPFVSGKLVGIYDRFVVPLARILERAVRIPVGKNLILVAKKYAAD